MPCGGAIYSKDEYGCATFIEARSQSLVKDYRFVALYFADLFWRTIHFGKSITAHEMQF